MYKYINMDKDFIPKYTKIFQKITQDNLFTYIKDLYSSLYPEYEEDDQTKEFFASYIYECPSIQEDLSSICFDIENFSCTPNEYHIDYTNNLCGLQTLENGLTLLGCVAGGDWEEPIFFFYYYDGEKIRAYIPSYGNMTNLDAKTAFGSEGEHPDISEEDLEKMYNRHLIKKEFFSMDDFTTPYLEKQNIFSTGDISMNWDAMREEILTVFKQKD